jgi:predicted KAP-like P-loop ATPase
MAFYADEYIGVIVEQIAENFSELERAVKLCPKLEKAKKEYRELLESDEEDFFAVKDALDKGKMYQQAIGDLVCAEYRTVEPLSVGLFGEWGSGKTHLLKLLESEINALNSNYSLSTKQKLFPQITIPIFFNAWRFEKEEHMIIPLFQTMLAQMEAYKHVPLTKKAKGFVKKGLFKLKFLVSSLHKGLKLPDTPIESTLKLLDYDISALKDVVDSKKMTASYQEKVKEAFEYETLLKEIVEKGRLESLYYHIPQYIEKIALFHNLSFVFLIDDLDRCLPENTLKMLESIKLFLDVPSCAFVLAIDDDVVERGVAYHYRDYLQRHESNVTLHLPSLEQETQTEKKEAQRQKEKSHEEEQQELPITGHEYLEKMVQLPFRIPVIDEKNIEDFLRKNYLTLFEGLLGSQRVSNEMIGFFAKVIPPKPRKMKRTVMLFSTKLKMLARLGIEVKKPLLVAKVTLLELFAPKLLRFIQNNDYRRIYDRLYYFRTFEKSKSKSEESQNEEGQKVHSLASSNIILEHIESGVFDQKEQELFRRLMKIVKESYRSRMVFDLDKIFDEWEDERFLKEVIELQKIVEEKKETSVGEAVTTLLSSTFIDKLQRENDSVSWQDAFNDEEALREGKATLSSRQLEKIIEVGEKNTTLASNPEWLGIIAQYVTNADYIKLLKVLYRFRFNPINDSFAMGVYQVTFWEYDRYCDIVGIEKPGDRGWGRGKRPVINVSWYDAQKYTEWLREALNEKYRLPTASEWRFACDKSETDEENKDFKWHFGSDERALEQYAWYRKNAEDKTHPVGEKKPNSLGLYDMHGNVWEWCEDWYDTEQTYKILRGGSWYNIANFSRSAFRSNGNPTFRINYRGFRLLRTLP